MFNNIKNYNRIIIIGCSGSGKSVLGKKIAEITGLPLIHLDNEYWQPQWVKTPRQEWIEKQKQFMEKEKWIIDGNYNGTLRIRIEAVDLIIFLDINRFICLFGAIRRHGKKRSDLPEYLEEKFDKDFAEFCKYILSFHKSGKMNIISIIKDYPEKAVLIMKNRRQVNKMIRKWKNN